MRRRTHENHLASLFDTKLLRQRRARIASHRVPNFALKRCAAFILPPTDQVALRSALDAEWPFRDYRP